MSGRSAGRLQERRTGEANLGKDGTNIDDSGPDKAGGSRPGPPAASLDEAVAAMMDMPHPLDILGEPGSYGFNVSHSGTVPRIQDSACPKPQTLNPQP